MEYYVHNHPNYRLYAVLAVIALYAGCCLGKLYGKRIGLDNFPDVVISALLHPLPIRFTPLTAPATALSLLVWMMVCLYHVSTVHNYMPGREYGTARFATPSELNSKLMDKAASKNKILSENLRVSTDTRKTGLNNNVLIIGGSGAGKTFYVVKPNGYNCTGSLFFCDPKIS